MTGRRGWQRRLVRAIVPVTVVSVVLGVAVVAVLADGFATKDIDLHDGGVWVTQSDDGYVGRFIVPIEELDAAVSVSATKVAEVQLLQDERTVFVGAGDGVLHRVDVADVGLSDGGARIPVPAGIGLGGGVVAVLDPSDGRLWVRSVATVEALDTADEEADATVGGDAAVAVGRDGTVYAVSGDTDRLVTATRNDQGVQTRTEDLAEDVLHPTVTAVGDRPVVLADGGRILIPGQPVRLLPDGPRQARLQQAGAASDLVAVATEDRLYGVPLDGGDAQVLSTEGSGGPAAPVQVAGCIYGAWSVRPVMARWCQGADPLPAVALDAVQLTSDRLEFRVNYDLVVLNQIGSGAIFTFKRGGDNLGHWENVKPPEPDPDPSEDPASHEDPPPRQNTPPQAVEDHFGARPGQATLLPVLDNDGDADHDFLVIKSVTAVGEGARLNIVANGQALQLVLAEGVTGPFRFRYTIDDGHGEKAEAAVTVQVRRPEDNTVPHLAKLQRPTPELELGGTLVYHVLTDWRDDDGDPLVLLSAAIDGPDQVRSTPDGFITFVDANATTGEKTVRLSISDGHGEPIDATQAITIIGRGDPAPPVLHDDRVVGFVDKKVVIDPLANDTDPNATAPGSSGGVRIFGVGDAPVGTTRELNPDTGKITFQASHVGSYYLTYEAAQGADTAEAKIRIDILPDSTRNPPVAVADTVVLRGTAPGTVDVLANDTDDDGDVLVISSVTVPEDSGLIVSVLDHRWLQVVAPTTQGAGASIEYTVSDGQATDVGVVTVSRLKITDDQPPSPHDDEAVVRAGDTVTIDVLANDVDPEGGLLTLGAVTETGDGNKGKWLVTGDTVRFQAPGTEGSVSAYYTVTDPGGQQASAKIDVIVRSPDPANNRRPQPLPLEARVFTGAVTRVHIPLSGVDPDGDSVILLGATNAPEHGRIVGRGIDYLDYEAYQGDGGTDTFSYLIRDPFGLEATGTVWVGIIPRPSENSAPVAVDDYYEVAPGALVNAPVLSNDSDVDGDALQLEGLDVPKPGISPDAAHITANRIVVVAPTTAGESVWVQYSVSDGRGLRSFATLRVLALDDANVAPTAQDDWVHHFPAGATSVAVPVLDNDDDVDGPRSELTVEPVGDDSGLAATWDANAHELSVELGDKPRQVAYRVTDAGGKSAVAFVHVPPRGDQAPYLRDGVEDLTITAGEELTVDLTEYAEDAEGGALLITEVGKIGSSPQPGLTVVDGSVGATTLTLHADPDYSGPATLVVELTDGTRLDGRRASITLNVTVTPADGRSPQVACPPVHPRAGAPEIVVDLRTCVLGLTPQQRDRLTFSDPSGAPEGVSVERDGSRLKLAAGRDVPPGTSGVLHFTIGGPWGDQDAELTVLVLEASLARANTDEVNAHGGTPLRFDVTANDTNPFPDAPLRVTSIEVLDGDVTVSLDGDGHTVNINPGEDFFGTATVIYKIQDVLNKPEREVQGRLLVHVITHPGPPGAPHEVSVGANRAVISFTAPNPNGAPITGYELQDENENIYPCASTTCELTGLENGHGYRFRAHAKNLVGWGDWSELSATITPDQRPDQPAAPTTQFGDGQITVTWTPPVNSGTPISGYVIDVLPGGPQSFDKNTLSYTFTGLENGHVYQFRVQASNGAPMPSDWSAWSAPEIPAGPPAAPGAPVAQGVGNGIGKQMTITWSVPQDNGDAVSGYTLIIKRAGVEQTPLTINGGDVTNATIDVDNGVQYTFQVIARNKAGDSARSPESQPAIAHGRPDQVINFTITDVDGSGHGYDGRVHYSITPPYDNGQAISRYEFDSNSDGAPDANYATADGYVTGLANGNSYAFRVRACNEPSGSCGDWSSPSGTVRPFGRPLAPGATATANGQTSIAFTWSVPGTNGRNLDRLEYRIDGGSWQTVSPPNGGNTSPGGYSPGSGHSIDVRVFDVTGWDSPITTASATTDNPPAAKATVSKGSANPPYDTCHSSACANVHLVLENFSPGTYTIKVYEDHDGTQFSQTTKTVGSSGRWEGDLGAYYGYGNAHVWVVVTPGNVESNHYTWPS